LTVGTVHSFAWNHIVRPLAGPAGHPTWAKLELASKEQAARAMQSAIVHTFGPYADTRFVDSTVRRYMKMSLSQDEWSSVGQQYQDTAVEYDRQLEELGLVDFDGVVARAVLLVEGHAFVRKVLQARYPYLMVDEYQDLAPGLHRIVTSLALAQGGCELFAVGDPNQAIYGWTGTRPELLLELAEDGNVHRVDLRINYRCGAVIAEAGRRILGDESASPVTMRGGGSVVVRSEPGGLEAQAHYISDRIHELKSQGVPLHEIAVLAPTNYDCDELVEVMRKRDLPVAWRTEQYGLTALTVVIEASAAWVAHGREDSGYRLGDLIDQWRQLADPDEKKSVAVQVVHTLLAAKPDGSAREFVDYLVRVLTEHIGTGALRSDDRNELERMQYALSDAGTMQHYTVGELGRVRIRDDRVEVSTMSASKGLEFDHVFIAALEQGKLPHYKSAPGSEPWKEDRRKFYVSLTRARESVEVLYSGWYPTSWKPRYNGPSIFLSESGLLDDHGVGS